MKLISMTDFVISLWDKDITTEDFAQTTIKYATFLKQPLKLEMFIPCDEDGNILIGGAINSWNGTSVRTNVKISQDGTLKSCPLPTPTPTSSPTPTQTQTSTPTPTPTPT